MRAVLDTNVVVSGMLSPHGPCGRILDLALEDWITLCLDERLVLESREVCHRPELGLPNEEVDRVIDFLKDSSDPVVAPPLNVALPDSDDLPFLEVAAMVEVPLVTGNRKHFPKRACRPVSILTPREFIDLLKTP